MQEIKTQSKWLRCGTQCVCCDLAESYLINKIDRIEAKLDKLLAKKETKKKGGMAVFLEEIIQFYLNNKKI
jgi:hypothetical protein